MYKLKPPIYTTDIKVCFQKQVQLSTYYIYKYPFQTLYT